MFFPCPFQRYWEPFWEMEPVVVLFLFCAQTSFLLQNCSSVVFIYLDTLNPENSSLWAFLGPFFTLL